MKRIFYFLSIIAASVAFAACNVTEVIEETPEVGVKVLTAYTDNDIATKTSLNGVSVIWSESDVITAFDAECVGYSSSQTQISQNGKVAQFTIEGMTVEDDVMMALYPANTSATMDEDMVITTEIPVEQIAVANSFANGANVAIAEGQGTELKFKNAGAILSFTLNDSDVKSVKLTTLDSKAVAGPCDICLDGGVLCCATTDSENDSVILTATEGQCLQANTSYYFVVIPDEFSGFRLEFTNSDGQTAKLKNATPVDLNSNDNYFIGDIPTLANKWKGGDTPNPARFEKVTSAPDNGDWSGDYLIVYETESLAFDGSLTTLDAASNTKPVTIENAKIAATSDMMAIQFTVAKKSGSSDKYNLKSASGYYISGTTTSADASNGLKQATSDSAYEITFEVEDNNVVVYSKSSDQNMILRYNDASNQNRFRFYKSGQKAISLYKFYGTIQAIPVESVSLDIEEYELGEGGHVQLTATVAPAEATNKNVTWSTSDDSVATVDNGLVTAVGEGTATITVTTEDGEFTAECEITVLPKYSITISSGIANGTVSSNVASAVAGTEITLTATPNAAYSFSSWDVKDSDGIAITVTDNKFTMPAKDIIVSATFTQKENHAIKISSSIANGTVTASLSEAYEGQEITLTPNPAAGYKFSGWDVKDANNNTISVESNKFRMPDAEVTVSATFVSQSVPEPVVLDKTISSYDAGEQYATNEKHDLGDGFVIYTTECHFTSELRIYSSSIHDGHVISDPFSGPITEIRFNAGNNSDTINVYGSNDGKTWTLVGSKSVAKKYNDYTVSFGTNSYKQFKLDVAGSNQVRIKTLGVTYTPAN